MPLAEELPRPLSQHAITCFSAEEVFQRTYTCIVVGGMQHMTQEGIVHVPAVCVSQHQCVAS